MGLTPAPNTPEGRAGTAKLTEDYADSGPPKNQGMKDQIVTDYQWMVIAISRRMQRRREPIEDLISVCNIGLLQALERFDPSMGEFRIYASKTMTGVLRRHYRDTWRIHVPRNVQELNLTLNRMIETLTHELQHVPTNIELADKAGVTVEDVIEAMDAGANFFPLSLSVEPTSAIAIAHLDDLGTVDETVDLIGLLAHLPELKRRVIYLYFVEDRTQTEIATILGVSQVTVSRIMRTGVVHLRALNRQQKEKFDRESRDM